MDIGLETTYGWVRRTREALFSALEELGPERYGAAQATLAGESVRDRHLHIADCYWVWLAKVGLGEDDAGRLDPAAYTDAAAARAAFAYADACVERFAARYGDRPDEPIEVRRRGQVLRLTPRWLLTHPITHEFHHKGQIVVVLRLFGVDPGDTDMVLPFGEAAR